MLLLDTCVFVWLTSEPNRLSAPARAALEAEHEWLLSDVCVWEICLKWQAKKLELPAPPRTWVSDQTQAWQLGRLAIEPEHFYRSTELEDLHRDPFDRLLVAQALTVSGKLITPDPAIARYPVSVIW